MGTQSRNHKFSCLPFSDSQILEETRNQEWKEIWEEEKDFSSWSNLKSLLENQYWPNQDKDWRAWGKSETRANSFRMSRAIRLVLESHWVFHCSSKRLDLPRLSNENVHNVPGREYPENPCREPNWWKQPNHRHWTQRDNREHPGTDGILNYLRLLPFLFLRVFFTLSFTKSLSTTFLVLFFFWG